MRLYKISTDVKNFGEGNEHLRCQLFVGTQTEAIAARKLFIAQGAARKDIESVEIEVPTTKAELINYLNELVK